jgi:NADH-quinone oxidoreductase subunit N
VNDATAVAGQLRSFDFVLPEVVLAVTACVLYLGGLFRPGRNLWGSVALLGLAGAGAALVLTGQVTFDTEDERRAALFAGPLVFDSLAVFIKLITICAGAVLVLLSWEEVPERQAADYHACLLLVLAGLCLTGSANDLVTLFVALELTSIPVYILLYLPRHDTPSQEAALKYFLLSVFSSALLLCGFSYLYGLAGTTNLAALMSALNTAERTSLPGVAHLALILVIAGLGFRITAVPFHFYAPDVYQGTATVNAAVLAFVPKVAGFAALLRVLGFVLPEGIRPRDDLIGTALSEQVPIVLWLLAAVTMTLGNLLALLQDNVKRMLAYSSVAHAGYMLVALAVAPFLRKASASGPDGVEALLFYLVAYGAMTVGAFAVLAYLHTPGRPVETVDDLAGLSRSHPGVSLLMAVFLFSLIGIPQTAGFTGKFLIFFGAMGIPSATPAGSDARTVEQVRELAQHAALYRWLAVIGVLNAAIGGWYYLRILAAMYLRTAVRPPETRWAWSGLATMLLCAILTVGLSVPPAANWLLDAARSASGPRTAPPSPELRVGR